MRTLLTLAFLSINLLVAQVPQDTLSVEREDLGATINSELSETRPYISGDGKTLYFCRRNSPDNVGGEKDFMDVYVSYLEGNNQWSEPENLGQPINTKKRNALAAIGGNSSDLYILNTFNFRNIPLYVSESGANGWGELKPILVEDYYNESGYIDIHVSEAHGVMLMAVDRWEGRGEQDIYVSFHKTGNNWTKPQSLGRKINTRQADFAPFLSADGTTLFFCSYGHRGQGNADIYASRRLDDSWENWTKPVNLGQGVNSNGEEVYFSITDDYEYMYLESFTPGATNRDIVRVPVPEEVKPPEGEIDPLVIASNQLEGDSTITSFAIADIRNLDLSSITASLAQSPDPTLISDAEEDELSRDPSITNPTQSLDAPDEEATLASASDESETAYPNDVLNEDLMAYGDAGNAPEASTTDYASTDDSNGSTTDGASALTTDSGSQNSSDNEAYALADINSGASPRDNEPADQPIRPTNSGSPTPTTSNGADEEYSTNFTPQSPMALPIKIREVNGQSQIDYLRNVYFDLGSTALPEGGKKYLDQVYALMSQDPGLKVVLSGHSDITGAESTNLRLSLQRANSAADYLKAKGLPKDRIRVEGFGGSMPLASNDDEREGREYNRRVDILLVYE